MRLTSAPEIRPEMENPALLQTVLALREEGKHKEALDIFLSIADDSQNVFESWNAPQRCEHSERFWPT
jgi:hypothetical protein